MGAAFPENRIPLSDGAGEVVECGADVTRVKVGERVLGTFLQSWIGGELEPRDFTTMLGGAVDGVLCDYRVFDEDGLVHLPAHLSFEEGATLPCAAVTAWNALHGPRAVMAGDTVLVLGTGGVATFAVLFARATGARVIVTSSSDAKIERIRTVGASDAVNYRTHAEWQREVRQLTHGKGVDHVVETGGPGTLARSIAATRIGGWVHLVGALTHGHIDPAVIAAGGVTVRGVIVGSRHSFDEMNRAIAFHGLHPCIDRTFSFDQASAAFRHLKSAEHVGKVIVRVA
ncbi:MAG: NAD(P)-dependent alcohol dehydrogenase [Steroidobacteraceae bacterium]